MTGATAWTAAVSGSQSRVFSGYCRDVVDGFGDPATLAFQDPPVKCLENTVSLATCTQPFESCEQADNGAFDPMVGAAAGHINIAGAPINGCLADGLGHSSTLAGLFSVPPAKDVEVGGGAAVNTFTNTPGPAALSHAFSVQLLP